MLENLSHPYEFLYENLMMESNVINCSLQSKIENLVFIGSTSVYPENASQPMKEECLLTGRLEASNEYYAFAKLTAVKLCESVRKEYGYNYISMQATNLYGLNDDFTEGKSHIIPSLVKRFSEAVQNGSDMVTVWGSGNARREFLYADDLAAAAVTVMNHNNGYSFLNAGYGQDYSIREIADCVAYVTGFKGKIEYDRSKPEGAAQRFVDSTKLRNLGWTPFVQLQEGIRSVYEDFLCSSGRRSR